MKAIRQIIDYLRERGVLSDIQLKQLAMQGFLPWEEIFGPIDEETPQPEPYRPIAQEEDETDRFGRRARPGGKRGGGRDVVHKGPVLEDHDLCERLTEQFDAWEPQLAALLKLARSLEPCESWDEAAIVLRNAEPDHFCRALCSGLASRVISMEALWEALSLESYRDVIAEEGVHGPAVNAYRAILEIDDPGQLGKHAWLLKEKEIRRVANLKAAQRRTLRACGFAFADCPEVFAAALRRDRRNQAYWAFVLLYSARRGTAGTRPPLDADEHWPSRDPLDDDGWMRAWAHALAMDPDRGPGLFAEHSSLVARLPERLWDALCKAPVPHSYTQLTALLDQHGFPPAEPAEPQVAEHVTLAAALATLKQQARQSAGLILPVDPEATRIWEEFLWEWFHFTTSSGNAPDLAVRENMDTLILNTFGKRAGLCCPRTWEWTGRF